MQPLPKKDDQSPDGNPELGRYRAVNDFSLDIQGRVCFSDLPFGVQFAIYEATTSDIVSAIDRVTALLHLMGATPLDVRWIIGAALELRAHLGRPL